MRQNLKLDLHLHSPYSDGSTPVKEMVSEAQKKGLRMMALTDHNTFNGIDEFKKCLNEVNKDCTEGIIGIAGIEISAAYFFEESEQEIHILGYFPLNTDFKKEKFASLNRLIAGYKNAKNRQLEMILENIIQDGYNQLSIPEFYEFAATISASGNLNRPSIARYLQKKGLVSSVAEAFDRFIGKDCKYFLELGKPVCQEAIQAIKAGGGLAVIAHLGEYAFNEKQRRDFFDFCKSCQIDGYELFHPHNDEEIINAVLSEADKNKELILTMGSDYHGFKVKPNNFIGQPSSDELIAKHKKTFDKISGDAFNRLCGLSGIHLK